MESALQTIIPDSPKKPYDMHTVITGVVDDGFFFEIQPFWAQNLLVGFSRLNGQVIGIVGNQPAHMAGTLDIEPAQG